VLSPQHCHPPGWSPGGSDAARVQQSRRQSVGSVESTPVGSPSLAEGGGLEITW